ncbi:hypothetical protein KIPB_003562 [Kipferlia bialata]|uniref:Uncharacterized protein n=1 Tax=Kipferlia bialata TaxID=797122 RepID=A0A9K3CSL0_9EUKA|nr:hypothetical protein KIPB_003562 [Kipferlia bialata]|eukprot:g3562.t1
MRMMSVWSRAGQPVERLFERGVHRLAVAALGEFPTNAPTASEALTTLTRIAEGDQDRCVGVYESGVLAPFLASTEDPDTHWKVGRIAMYLMRVLAQDGTGTDRL